MSGNVWEWTRSLWGEELSTAYMYPYNPADVEREAFDAPTLFCGWRVAGRSSTSSTTHVPPTAI
jgi:formylglycine-generating enzyme required for sulfatase activity